MNDNATQTQTIHAYAAQQAGGPLEKFSYEVGDLKPNEVEIDVLHCGICHSDLSMIDNEWGMSKYPLVAGHEVIGRVAAVGPQVSRLQPGMTVGLGWHSGYCGECACCQTGDQNLCQSAESTIVARHGGFADKVRADAASVVVIPEGIDLAAAGPLLCGGITVFGLEFVSEHLEAQGAAAFRGSHFGAIGSGRVFLDISPALNFGISRGEPGDD